MKKIVLITGGGSPLAKNIADKLLESGNIVYLTDRQIDESTGEISNLNKIKLDVNDELSCRKAVDTIIFQNSRLDVLVNLAGISPSGKLIEVSDSEFLEVLNTNAISHLRMAKSVYPQMKKQGDGRIINVTSINGLVSLPGFGIYSASKFAAEALGQAMHYELSSDNISVTNIAPGAIKREESVARKLDHKPAREKFKILKYLMPFTTDEKVSDGIMSTINAKNPPIRVIIGTDAKIIYYLNRYLPLRFWDWLIKIIWNRK